ncbi:MAG: glycosyltransferase family 4 protein [Chitinophagaceae bacterium]|nr:glycosyltransferase family 4 protein [Chitinophagaceae bacterium]
MKKLIIITTHPIQYNAPLFKIIAARRKIALKVFYTWGKSVISDKFDPGFGKNISWDIPLLEGYEYEFLENIATVPGSHHSAGIDNPDIINKINEANADAILIYGWNFKSHFKVMKYFKNKKPIYFRGDSTLLNEPRGLSFKKILRRIYLNWIYSYIDKAFYVGTNNKKYFIAHGVKNADLIYVPHAVDNKRFSKDEEECTALAKSWRSKLGIGENEIAFLFAGKLEWNKNPFILLEAFENLNERNVHLILIGNGALEEDIKRIYGTKKNIHFIDFQNQSIMPVAYRLGDWFVLPSQSETWGLSINEAMASGRPVIASDRCGGAIDLIENGVSGFIFPWSDKSSLTTIMKIAIQQKKNMHEIRKEVTTKISSFSFEHDAEAIEQSVLKCEEV